MHFRVDHVHPSSAAASVGQAYVEEATAMSRNVNEQMSCLIRKIDTFARLNIPNDIIISQSQFSTSLSHLHDKENATAATSYFNGSTSDHFISNSSNYTSLPIQIQISQTQPNSNYLPYNNHTKARNPTNNSYDNYQNKFQKSQIQTINSLTTSKLRQSQQPEMCNNVRVYCPQISIHQLQSTDNPQSSVDENDARMRNWNEMQKKKNSYSFLIDAPNKTQSNQPQKYNQNSPLKYFQSNSIKQSNQQISREGFEGKSQSEKESQTQSYNNFNNSIATEIYDLDSTQCIHLNSIYESQQQQQNKFRSRVASSSKENVVDRLYDASTYERRRIQFEKQEQARIDSEMSHCTFKPRMLSKRVNSLHDGKINDSRLEHKQSMERRPRRSSACSFDGKKDEIAEECVRGYSSTVQRLRVGQSRSRTQKSKLDNDSFLGKNFERNKKLKFNPPSMLARESGVFFKAMVRLSDGREKRIVMSEKDDPKVLASSFARRYQLSEIEHMKLESTLSEYFTIRLVELIRQAGLVS